MFTFIDSQRLRCGRAVARLDEIADSRRLRRGRAVARLVVLCGFFLSATPGIAAEGAKALPPLVQLRTSEYEAVLAKEPTLYLVLDPRAKHLDIRSRAMVLERVPLADLLLLEFQPLFAKSGAPELGAPALWKVTQGPGDTDRETIAPLELRPYSEEEDKEEPAPTTPGAAPAAPTPAPKKKPDEAPIPTSYRVLIDNGWQLYITADPPQSTFFRRFVASVKDGWSRLRGEEPQHPPLITLVVSPEGAARLHHLFRSGTEILVLP
ncbi:MAG: hypothetical protein ABI639_06435 [Thermoanaerobaculia bacterium]